MNLSVGSGCWATTSGAKAGMAGMADAACHWKFPDEDSKVGVLLTLINADLRILCCHELLRHENRKREMLSLQGLLPLVRILQKQPNLKACSLRSEVKTPP